MTPEPKHYGPPTEPVLALTKEEHDELVELLGRPITQDPRPLRADTVSGRTRAIDPVTDKPWGG